MPMFLIRLLMLFFVPLWVHAYTFHTSLSKSELLLGEEVNLTVIFNYNSIEKEEIEEYEIEEPSFENIKTTLISDEEYQENNTTWGIKQIYMLTPTKRGKLRIPPLNLHIESIDIAHQKVYNRNTYLEKIDLPSKELELNVQALPEGVKISGDYRFVTTVNKRVVNAGQPIEFRLALEGKGSLESLDFFTLKIPHTTIYTQPSTTFSKSFTIVADRNYSIPAVMLKYYNQKSHSIELINSPVFSIVVNSDTPIKEKRYAPFFYGALIVGFLLLLLYGLYFKLSSSNPNISFIRTLKRSQSKEDLLKRTVPYMNKSKNLRRLIFKLETSDKQAFKSLKKEIIKEIHLLKEKK